MKALGIVYLAFVSLSLISCGGGSAAVSNGPIAGNWQFTLSQNYPRPAATLAVSGFLANSTADAVTGSVQVPAFGSNANCGGVSLLTGTLSGENVTLSVNASGTVFNLIGTVASGSSSMSGTYQAIAGSCFEQPTTGSWSAILIPPLNGSFTGTLSNSGYMSLLTGISPAAPITVTGTMSQSENAGASNATLNGTINAVGYPCFASASLTGTISGENVTLSVFSYDGSQIGTLGTGPSPAIVSSGISGTTLDTVGTSGSLVLGKSSATTTVGPCPALNGGSGTQIGDTTDVALTFQ